MRTRTVVDGNAFYEIDEACMEKRQEELRENKMRAEERDKKNGVFRAGGKSEYREKVCRKSG